MQQDMSFTPIPCTDLRLISTALTRRGFALRAQLRFSSPVQYPSAIIVSDAEMAAIKIQRAEFHGE